MSAARQEARDRLEKAIRTRSARCAVVGLGFIGTTVMDALLEAGFEVHGYDRDGSVAARYRARGPVGAATTAWSAGDDPTVLSGADVVVVAVRALVLRGGTVELEPLRSVAAQLEREASSPRLILVKCTVPPGTTRRFAEDGLGIDSRSPIFVAHAPDRLSVGDDWQVLRRTPHLVGALDAAGGDLAECLMGSICERVVRVSSPEISELSKLLENAFLSVGISLVGEITRLAHGLEISAHEVCEAASTKTVGYFPFLPGPGVGGHCLPNDLQLLNASSRELGSDSRLLVAAREVLGVQPRLTVERLEQLLAGRGQRLQGSPVLLVGVGFKPGVADTTMTPAADVVRHLRARGALPNYLDRRVPGFVVDQQPVPRIEPGGLEPGQYAACLVLAGDDAVDPERLAAASGLVLDAGGARILRGPIAGMRRL